MRNGPWQVTINPRPHPSFRARRWRREVLRWLNQLALVLALLVLLAAAKLSSETVWPGLWRDGPAPQPLVASQGVAGFVYYRSCDEARAAGAAPLTPAHPGYRAGLDGDGDGVACEPYLFR